MVVAAYSALWCVVIAAQSSLAKSFSPSPLPPILSLYRLFCPSLCPGWILMCPNFFRTGPPEHSNWLTTCKPCPPPPSLFFLSFSSLSYHLHLGHLYLKVLL